MTIIAPLYITQSPELATALKTKNRAQSNNQKLHSYYIETRCMVQCCCAKMEACRFDKEAKSCFRQFQEPGNTVEAKYSTQQEMGERGGGILEPNKHLIFPFPLRINTVKVTFSLGTDICLPMMILLMTTQYLMSSARIIVLRKPQLQEASTVNTQNFLLWQPLQNSLVLNSEHGEDGLMFPLQ